MYRITSLLCLLAFGNLNGQQITPSHLILQEQPPLRIQVRDVPQAKKAYNTYRLKIISGTIVGSSGVILLNHALGSISPQAPHQWELTGIGIGLVGTGLLITKGAKKKRLHAMDLLAREKK